MTIKEALNEYKFDNVGQYMAIGQALGYKTNYKEGTLSFSKGDEFHSTTVNAVRAHLAGTEPNEEAQKASREHVCKFFDKDKALLPEYAKEMEKEGLSIIKWDGLKGERNGEKKDGFTIVDHKNKVVYTGRSLYDHAFENGYVLDGKGTQLEKGVMSEMMDVNGKSGKLRFTDKGVSVFYRKEALTIPDRILGQKINKKKKEQLLDGDIVPLSYKGSHVFLQVDRDLNSVIVKTNKEINIPNVIGRTDKYEGYKLTEADKHLLANGFSLENKLMHSDQGFIIANISLTDDKKGISFNNIQTITDGKAQEIIKQLQKEGPDKKEEKVNEQAEKPQRDFDSELREATAKYDFAKMSDLKDEGYKPSEEVIRGLGKEMKITEVQSIAIEKIFGIKPEVTPPEAEKSEKIQEQNMNTENQRETSKQELSREDREFLQHIIDNNGKFPKVGEVIGSATLTEGSIRVTVERLGMGEEYQKSLSSPEEMNIEKEVFRLAEEKLGGSKAVENGSEKLIEAALKNDFDTIFQLKEKGFSPSNQDMIKLKEAGVSDSNIIAIQKIFGNKAQQNTLGDVRLATPIHQGKGSDIHRPLANTINKAFSDL